MGSQINSLILEGNLVRDIEVKNINDRVTVGKFTIAVNRLFKKADGITEEEVSFFDIECFGAMATKFKDKLKKGRGVRVVGRLKQDRWKSAQGVQFSKVVVVAEHLEIKPDKPKESNENESKETEYGEVVF